MCLNRIGLPYKEGGRGLMSLEKEYKETMIGMYKYMVTKNDIQIKALLRHQNTEGLYSEPKKAEKYLAEVGTTGNIDDHLKTAKQKAKKLKETYNKDYIK